jgi:phospholipid/cholesterol/gamma-HCH transport system substrate-binding protein
MKNSLETRLGMFGALVAVGAVCLLELGGGLSWFKSGRTVRARFNSIQDLKVGDPVKLAGVPVGRVSRIDLVADKVEVTLHLEKQAQIHTDSTAIIKFAGMMGQNFVSLDFGTPSAPLVTADALLQTREQPDLATLMEKLQGVADGVQTMTKSFSGEEFSKLLGPLTDLVKDNNPRITSILTNAQAITAQVASGQGTLGRLLFEDSLHRTAMSMGTNLNDLAGDAKLLLADTRGLVGDTRKVVAGIDRGEGSVGKLLKDDTMAKDLTAATTSLKEILQKINSGQGSVGKLVNDDAFLRNIKMTLQKVDKATEGLEDTGPLQVLGTAVQSLF